MRKSGKKRKYAADPTAAFRTMSGFVDFTEEEIIKMSLPIRTSLQKFTLGTADDRDWNTLAHVVNVTVLRGEAIAQEVVECGKNGQRAVLSILHRYNKTLKWGVNHEDLQRLVDVVDVHEQLLRLSKPKDLIDAVVESQRRVKAGKVVVLLEDCDD